MILEPKFVEIGIKWLNYGPRYTLGPEQSLPYLVILDIFLVQKSESREQFTFLYSFYNFFHWKNSVESSPGYQKLSHSTRN